jgi:hypothetical protein
VSNEIIGYKATLAYSDTQNGTYVVLAGILELDPNELKIKEVDKTAHDSPNYAQEFQPGMIDPGEVSFKMHFKKTSTAAIYTLATNRTTSWWRITLNDHPTDPSNWKSQGFLSSLKNMVPLNDNCTLDAKIKMSGLPIFTQGS